MGKFDVSSWRDSSILWSCVGLLIPANWLESIGVNDHIYHIEQYILVVFLV